MPEESKVTRTLILSGETNIVDALLYSTNLVTIVSYLKQCSRSEARRLIKGGAVSIGKTTEKNFKDFQKITDDKTMLCGDFYIKIGKFTFFEWKMKHEFRCV